MSFSISAVSPSNSNYDATPAPAPKAAPKPTEADQIKTLASQGRSASQIATAVGLPETLVAEDLGTATTTSASTSQAGALLALSARLSVQA